MRSKLLLMICFAAQVAFGSAFAQGQSASQLQSQVQAANRSGMWGIGPTVRFGLLPSAQEVFSATGRWPVTIDPQIGRLENNRVHHQSLPLSVPLAEGPCRLVRYQSLRSGIGAAGHYQCRDDQALPYVQFSFERIPHEWNNAFFQRLNGSDRTHLGVTYQECEQRSELPSLSAVSCFGAFAHFVALTRATEGKKLVWIISDEREFLKVSTACAGSQCDAALPAFEQFVRSFSFATIPGDSRN